jgi:hypothetical protein
MYPESKDTEALNSVDDKNQGPNALADDITKRVATRLVANSNRFKQSRLDQIQKYRDLYAGKVAKKFRQPFNVVLPTLAGMMDTLAADFNDDLSVDLSETEPADYIAIRKDRTAVVPGDDLALPNARFPYLSVRRGIFVHRTFCGTLTTHGRCSRIRKERRHGLPR